MYYGNGDTFDNSDGSPENAPKLNTQCIVTNDKGSKTFKAVEEVGKLVLHDWDYYIYTDKMGWFGVRNLVDLVDHVVDDCNSIRAVLKARSIDTEMFREIYNKAWRDEDFPRKSAIRSDEADQHFGLPED